MLTLKRIVWVIFGVLLITVGAIIGIENETQVAFSLFGVSLGQMPLGLWVLTAFSLGAVVALLVTQLSVTALRRRVRSLNKQLVLAQQKNSPSL